MNKYSLHAEIVAPMRDEERTSTLALAVRDEPVAFPVEQRLPSSRASRVTPAALVTGLSGESLLDDCLLDDCLGDVTAESSGTSACVFDHASGDKVGVFGDLSSCGLLDDGQETISSTHTVRTPVYINIEVQSPIIQAGRHEKSCHVLSTCS